MCPVAPCSAFARARPGAAPPGLPGPLSASQPLRRTLGGRRSSSSAPGWRSHPPLSPLWVATFRSPRRSSRLVGAASGTLLAHPAARSSLTRARTSTPVPGFWPRDRPPALRAVKTCAQGPEKGSAALPPAPSGTSRSANTGCPEAGSRLPDKLQAPPDQGDYACAIFG
ncbi:hypothetical protein NDU88_004220 [Pleurodeles waltl]|uniref:Uncharacterized protein n=1 Tax=Pleurodeles waltl TaxID=8319 RepID=A0AAV7V0N7_PLEWA|nr:hypothetical protein NDU88_004220 [Pleurodeles waltl]